MSRLLFIWYKRSKDILEGGGQCSQKNYSVVAQLLGAEQVTSYYVHDEFKKKSVWGYLKGICFMPFNYYYGLTPGRVAEIVRLAADHDYVFIDRSLFGIVAKRLKEVGYRGRIICFFHNIECVYFASKLSERLPGRGVLLRCADANDRYSCRYADRIVALNQRDSDELQRRYGRRADVIIPIALKDRYAPTDAVRTAMTRQRPLCLFLGSYFPPNNEGILWFVHHVLPHVRIEMKVVGKGMARLKEEQSCLRQIEVIGDAPDLTPYFEEADLMILPIFAGSGMKVKTCESLMYGKHILATTEAFEGYDVDYDRVGGLCNTADEFIARINRYCDDPQPRFNPYSRQTFLARYSEQAVVDLYRRLLFD